MEQEPLTTETFDGTFGSLIKGFRTSKGLGQGKFASDIGADQSQISFLEKEYGAKLPEVRRRIIEHLYDQGYVSNDLRGVLLEQISKINFPLREPETEESYADRIPALRKAVMKGFSLEKILEETGLKYLEMKGLAAQIGLLLPDFRKCKINEQNLEKVKTALKNGVKSRTELSGITGVSYAEIMRYEEDGLIKTPKGARGSKKGKFSRGKIVDNKAWFDERIKKGMLLKHIAKEFGDKFGETITGERVRQYVKWSGKYDIWRGAQRMDREAAANEKTLKQDVVDTLLTGAIKKADQEGYGEALNYYHSAARYRTTPLHKVIDLLKAHKSAESMNIKLSYKELAELSGLRYASLSREILKKMNKDSLYWTADTPDVKKRKRI